MFNSDRCSFETNRGTNTYAFQQMDVKRQKKDTRQSKKKQTPALSSSFPSRLLSPVSRLQRHVLKGEGGAMEELHDVEVVHLAAASSSSGLRAGARNGYPLKPLAFI